MKKLLLFTLLILNYSFSFATVRYVSHFGSNTPPYTTWETAADSIQKCIDYSAAGDTIYVANGVYKEAIIINKTLNLIGSSIDSCIIDTRDLVTPTDFQSVYIGGGIIIFKYFNIVVSSNHTGLGIANSYTGPETIIENNRISGADWGIEVFNSNANVKHNLITDANTGIHLEAFSENYFPVIDSNIIVTAYNFSHGIEGSIGTSSTIRNNLIICEMGGSGISGILQPLAVENNIVIKKGDGLYGYGFALGGGIIANNSIFGNSTESGFHILRGSNRILNNNLTNSQKGYEFESPDTIKFHYNNVWDTGIPYTGFTPDSTNITADPMFVNEDSSDFHLQKYSPLIDAGDPAILDKDGSRSDIGLYGGLLGESYTYQDLAPRTPVNVTAVLDSNQVLLSWNKNTEADFKSYRIYRDTIEGFIIDSTKLISEQSDTFFVQTVPKEEINLYYKLTAIDSQGNESGPSEEVHIIITTVITKESVTINNYKLYQNYPNPFNPATRIGYRLKERGYVKLMVYDIKGELVETLVNKVQDGGYYESEFEGKDWLASGIYLYRIEVINENHIPVFTDIRKMVFLK